MAKQMNKKIVLADGSEYYGYGFGANIERVCEIVFDIIKRISNSRVFHLNRLRRLKIHILRPEYSFKLGM